MTTFRTGVFGLILAGLFMISMVNFGVTFVQQQGGNVTLLDDPIVRNATDGLNISLFKIRDTSEDQATAFEDEPQKEEADAFEPTRSILGTIRQIPSLVKGIYNVIAGFVEQGLGIPRIVVTVIGGMLALFFVLAGWKVWRAGE